MVGSECAIFVEDSRVSGNPGRELRVDASRGPEYPGLNVVSHACRRPAYAALLRVPRRISLGFAHSAAAAGDWRKSGRTQHVPVGKPFAFPTNSG